MKKIRVFISSVQSEFAEERQMLFDYLTSDALLGLFFEPFIFEKLPAANHSVSSIYLKEVEQCDLYIGLFGKDYGYEDAEGISPTERELLFKDRLEVWNPGHLPYGLTIAKLREPHNSIPANLLLAEPMYLAGYIERMGTGTGDIIRWCKEAGLQRVPEFAQEEIFKTIIWRKEETRQATGQVTPQVTEEINPIKKIVCVMEGEMRRLDIQNTLGLNDRKYFADNYLKPALDDGYIEMLYPDSPNHPQQRYRLTLKGIQLKSQIKI